MADLNDMAGLAAATLGPAAVAAWMLRRLVRRIVRTVLIVAVLGAGLWAGGAEVLGRAISAAVATE